MWLHPLFRTLATQPDLLADHAGAYLALASAEVDLAARQVRARAQLAAAALACGALGTGLAGMALLLLAAMPVQAMPAPWALAVVPAVPFVLALALWQAQRRLAVDLRFAALREQLALDQQLWQRVSTS